MSKQLIILIVPLVFGACTSEKFSGGAGVFGGESKSSSSNDSEKNDEGAVASGTDHLTKDFEVGGASSGTDIVWIIDNSGSMGEEVAAVEKNFAQFLANVKTIVDTKVAFITCKLALEADDYCLTEANLNAGPETMFIDSTVGSTDALAIGATAICPPETSMFPPDVALGMEKICDIPVTDLDEDINYNLLKGRLKDFFRQGSRPVVVVVSDDTVEGFMGTSFQSVMDKKFGLLGWQFYGFVGLPTSVVGPNCQVEAVSPDYQALATNTKGALFDLCAADWAGNFKALSEGIIYGATKLYVIADSKKIKVIDVLHNGKSVPKERYEVADNKVMLADDFAVTKGDKIQIIYDDVP
ncbi:MAG: hypothetical protein AB7T49_05095 [Oligoflexales bacterium]